MTSVWSSIALRCAQLILGSLIVAALASTVYVSRIPPLPPIAPAQELGSALVAFDPLETFAVIEQRNLFRQVAGGTLAIPGSIPTTRLDLELVGTIVAGGVAGGSIALVRDARDQVTPVREGERIVGGRVRLVSIEPRRIMIEHDGLLERVALASEDEKALEPQAERAVPVEPPKPAELEAHAGDGLRAASSSDQSMLEALRSAAKIPPRPGEPE